MIRRRRPALTVCVPVFDAADVVAETLAAIAAQTVDGFVVLIGDDASTDGSVAACEPFLDDGRFRLVRRPSRLGWVANTNLLLREATTPWVAVVPHDDLPDPAYFERLIDEARRTGCAVAFADLEVFGLAQTHHLQPSALGSPFERLLSVVEQHHDGTAFRGVVRTDALAESGGLPSNPDDDFAADVTWLAHLAVVGELRRVPQVLYRKRRRAGSASLRWGDWDDRRRTEAWGRHCAEVLRAADRLVLTGPERRRLAEAAERRLTWLERSVPGAAGEREHGRRAFEAALAGTSWAGAAQ